MTTRRATIAASYLEHIRIALEAGDRGAPFRTFIDNWAALSAPAGHHVSAGDRPKWFNNPCLRTRQAMLYSLDFRSRGTNELLDYTPKCHLGSGGMLREKSRRHLNKGAANEFDRRESC